MSQIIKHGNELIRINTQKNTIEFSISDGRNWSSRFTGSMCGTFYDLTNNGREILATTSKGVYFSNDGGHNWNKR